MKMSLLAIPGKAKSKFLRFFSLAFCLSLLMIITTGCESERAIVHGLDEKEANEILVFLANRGIEATKVQAAEGGGPAGGRVLWNVTVDIERASEATSLLNQAGLPRRRGQNLLQIFSDVGLVPSGMQDKIRFQAGLAEQIASTIRKFDGVLDAEVQISFPEEDPLNPTATRGNITASVYVKHSGVLDDPNAHLVTKIKRLVAGSVNGLDYDNVTVIGERSRFADYTIPTAAMTDEDKTFVNIWTLVIGKESVFRFRLIFFSFFILLALLLMALVWTLWKVYPVLKNRGGMQELFHLKPLEPSGKVEPEQEEKPEDQKENKTEEEKDTDRDFDETT